MGIGLILAISQCVGIFFWQITTDPVDLWASPNSRSRLEKNYYDENFEPFYRTAQIFIRPIGFESVSDGLSLLLLFLYCGYFYYAIYFQLLCVVGGEIIALSSVLLC